jgi:predicted transcriptional regulator/GNAT superfamily N-acetyltransferase
MQEYPDRIISKEEIDELKNLLLSQNLDYPNYPNWVGKIIKEIYEGKRYAFGLFSEGLCGDGVVRVTSSGTVELRNFYLAPDSREKGNGTKLLNYIEDYCVERGYSQIQVDSDVSDVNTVNFFLRHGFEFQSRADFYGRGKDSYLLVKRLPLKYIGEYDWVTITKWVLEKLWNFRLEKEIEVRKRYIYNKSDKGMNISATVNINESFGADITETDLQKFNEVGNTKGILFCFGPSFTKEAEAYAKEKGITIINRDELESLTGYILPKSHEDTAGLIVSIKPEFFENLKINKDRVFVKGGPMPHTVASGQVIVFYVTSPSMGIKGYAKIMNISSDSPAEIWAKHSRQSAFSEEEYMTYVQGKTIVTAYSFDHIKEMPQTLDLDRVRSILSTFNHQAGQKITISEWERLMKS